MHRRFHARLSASQKPLPAEKRRIARRPASHHLGLGEITHVIDTAWRLAKQAGDHRTYANALRVEVAVMTMLRLNELHNARPSDFRPDGTINVRMLHAEDSPTGRGLKFAKPRVAAFINGLDASPTLHVLQRYIHGDHRPKGRPVGRGSRGLPPDPEAKIWPSTPKAWWHWVVHTLGPATGLQRRLSKLNGDDAHQGVPRYLIHPHAFRAAGVLVCRRWPRSHGQEPVPWETICELGGWDSVDTIRQSYYYADLDENLTALRKSMPAHLAPAPARPIIDVNGRSWGQ